LYHTHNLHPTCHTDVFTKSQTYHLTVIPACLCVARRQAKVESSLFSILCLSIRHIKHTILKYHILGRLGKELPRELPRGVQSTDVKHERSNNSCAIKSFTGSRFRSDLFENSSGTPRASPIATPKMPPVI
jgi:hypothetical protein